MQVNIKINQNNVLDEATIPVKNTMSLGRMDGWKSQIKVCTGWMDVGAGLRIAYSNLKSKT